MVLFKLQSVSKFAEKTKTMKKTLLFTSMMCLYLVSKAQIVEDSIYMLPGYTNESYYSFQNGEIQNIDNTSWDIAFDLSGYGASVRSNEHIGTEVYLYSGSDWQAVDTTGIIWDTFHNSETTWKIGAFDQSANPADPFDLGWGAYNPVTHTISGNKIYIIKLSNGAYKKIMIESLISGTYSFKYANLDGSDEMTNSVTKSDYNGKNFIYYSITTHQPIDREPMNSDWDIVFTKYSAEIAMGPGAPTVNYSVTGVLSNNNIYVREASGVDPLTADFLDYQVDSVINVIGYDWKSFNGMGYTIEPNLSYFIEDHGGNIWHLLFTDFEGSSTGKIVFGKNLISSANTYEIVDVNKFEVFPNPANNNVSILINTSSVNSRISITDMSGKIVHYKELDSSGLINYPISVSHLNSGSYFVKITTDNGQLTKKLIIH